MNSTQLKLLKIILENEKSEFIQRVADFVKKEEADFWNKLSAIERNKIKQGIEELDSGKRIPYNSFLKKTA